MLLYYSNKPNKRKAASAAFKVFRAIRVSAAYKVFITNPPMSGATVVGPIRPIAVW